MSLKIDEKALEKAAYGLQDCTIKDPIAMCRHIIQEYDAAKTEQPDEAPQPYVMLTLAEFGQLTAMKRVSGSRWKRVAEVLRKRLDKYEPPKDHDPDSNAFLKEMREVYTTDIEGQPDFWVPLPAMPAPHIESEATHE